MIPLRFALLEKVRLGIGLCSSQIEIFFLDFIFLEKFGKCINSNEI